MSDEAMLEPEIETSAAIHATPEGSEIALDPDPSVEAAVSLSETQPMRATTEAVRDWREELAAKMQDYRTRRKPRAPKYPSLQMPLQLPAETSEVFDSFRTISADVSRSSN